MALPDSAYSFRVSKVLGGDGQTVLWGSNTISNLTLAVGDAVVFTTDAGLIGLATAADVAIAGFSAETVVGVSTTQKNVNFVPALKHYVFRGQSSGTPTAGLIGEDVDMEGATGAQEINENASSIGLFRIVGVFKGSSLALNGELEFIVNKSQFVGAG